MGKHKSRLIPFVLDFDCIENAFEAFVGAETSVLWWIFDGSPDDGFDGDSGGSELEWDQRTVSRNDSSQSSQC